MKSIEDLKRWQWMIIGAIAGLALGYGAMLGGAGRDPKWRPPISDADLASALSDDNGVRDLVLAPDDAGKTYVTGEIPIGQGRYRPFAVYTGSPFPASGSEQSRDIQTYIEKLKAAGKTVDVRQAWWEQTWVKLGWPTLAGILIVGGIWPSLLNLMVGAGLGRKRPEENDYNLDRFGKGEESSKLAAPPSPDNSEVIAAAQRLETQLASSNPAPPAPAISPAQSPKPVVLTGRPVETIANPVEVEEKNYKGEFYPVAQPGGKKPGAFTLVELLVVIGIIGVLMGLLLPALAGARRSASVVACASNMRQIGYALQSYLNSNRGVLFWRGDRLQGDGMDWYAYGGQETGNANRDTGDYFNQILPRPLNSYIGKQRMVFHCPNDQGAPWTADPSSYSGASIYPADSHFDWVGNSYNFNANGYPLRPLPRHDGGLDGVQVSSIHDSSHMIVLYEACLYWGGDWHFHHKANIAYIDGHVSFLPFPPEMGEDHWNP